MKVFVAATCHKLRRGASSGALYTRHHSLAHRLASLSTRTQEANPSGLMHCFGDMWAPLAGQ